jgi:hypothetical protein
MSNQTGTLLRFTIGTKPVRALLFVAALAIGASCVVAGNDAARADDMTLNAEKISALFVSNTISGKDDKGNRYRQFFTDDGKTRAKYAGSKKIYQGKWKVDDENNYCEHWGEKWKCYGVVQKGDDDYALVNPHNQHLPFEIMGTGDKL